MGKKWNGLKWMVLTMIVAVVLAGCVALQKSNVSNPEQRLAEDPIEMSRPENVTRKGWP